MVEVLLFVNIGMLVIGSVTLTIAVVVLQRARGYVEVAEERLERLREGQERMFSLLREEQRLRARRLEGEVVEPLTARSDEFSQRNDSYAPETRHEGPVKNAGTLRQQKPVTRTVREDPKMPTTKRREPTPTGGPKETQQGGGVAVKHAHPDDDVSLQRTETGQSATQGHGPRKVFREHYHRYLENYEGYVRLAGRLCDLHEAGEVPAGSPAEREWKERLRRLNDGIRRTTARLDILEQYNPELASDDRVSHRAGIARSYSEIEEKLAELAGS